MWLLALMACFAGSVGADGTVLWVGDDSVVVQHDGVAGRTVPGTTHYDAGAEVRGGLSAGDAVTVWADEDAAVPTLERASVTGRAEMPPNFNHRGHPLKGLVVRVDRSRVTVDHEPIRGVMGAMVMAFDMREVDASELEPGQRIDARMIWSDYGYRLVDAEVVGVGDASVRSDVERLKVGQLFPGTAVPVEDGTEVVLGEGQDRPTLLTFLYTTCPDPTFCPALATRLGALQPKLQGKARILAITMDVERDTLEVLAAYGEMVGADPNVWRFGRLSPAKLQEVAMLSGLAVKVEDGKIAHSIRVLLLDGNGKLVERYDHNQWDLDRVANQLLRNIP